MSIIGNRVRQLLRDCSGSGQILTIVILLVVLMTLAFLMECMRVFSLTLMVREAVEQATVSAAASNAYNAFAGIREGNAAPYVPSGSDWHLVIETSDVASQLVSLHALRRSGDSFCKEVNEAEQWSIHGLQVTALPPDVRSDNSVLLRFEATYTVRLPVRFLGSLKGNLQVNQTAKSSYIPLY